MSSDPYAAERGRMVDRLEERGYCSRRSTAEAIRTVPRHAFIPEDRRHEAYADRPLPIGDGQTISAPHMVATMVDLLALNRGNRVLEIGTGCGYHAAVTAEVVGPTNVYTVEVSEPLATAARERLRDLGYGDIVVHVGDGAEGLPAHAPYDASYLTCASADIPAAIIEQVNPGGRIVAPIGSVVQELVLATVNEDGSVDQEYHGGVRFVQMRGPSRG